MKFKTSLIAIAFGVLLSGTSSVAQADLVAYWNFNALSWTGSQVPGAGGSPTSIFASTGAGTLDLTSWGGTIAANTGDSLNALFGDPAGNSLIMVRSTNGNGTFIDFDVDLTGLFDPVLTFATNRGTNGFTTGTWQWSNDGSTFTAFGGNTAGTGVPFTLGTVNGTGIVGLYNQATVTFRYTLNGAALATGNNRIDNFQINATAVPEPGTALLAGLALVGLVAGRRRR